MSRFNQKFAGYNRTLLKKGFDYFLEFLKNWFSRKPGLRKGYGKSPWSYSGSAWSITYNPLDFDQKAIYQLGMFPREHVMRKEKSLTVRKNIAFYWRKVARD